MAELEVYYPFTNSNTLNSTSFATLVKGKNGVFEKTTNFRIGGGNNGYVCNVEPLFWKSNRYYIKIIIANRSDGSWPTACRIADGNNNNNNYTSISGTTTLNTFYRIDDFHTRDYSTIPFYSLETSHTRMFAIDSLSNMMIATERLSMSDISNKTYSLMIKKNVGGTDECPLGLYEYTSNVSSAAECNQKRLNNEQYQSPNTGYCNTYMMYQYTREGYIYPDIYYSDGGLSVPPDGICQIGPSRFLKICGNFFLKMD